MTHCVCWNAHCRTLHRLSRAPSTMREEEAGVKRFVVMLVVLLGVTLSCDNNPTALVHHRAAPVGAHAALVAGYEELPFVSLGFDPTAMEFAPDGRLFVSDEAGNLRVIKNG